MSAIWRRDVDEWRPLLPSGFTNEAALHDLVAEAPHLLPLSGNPSLVVVGREVNLGSGYADLVAVEADGRLVIIEIKLRKNAEARRAVVAQVLMYAAYLKGVDPRSLETEVLSSHFTQQPFDSLEEAARGEDQTGTFDAAAFAEGVSASLAGGAFRLVLVLDEAPPELVQLVGYLESVSSGVILDLITVSAYDLGDQQIMVPQRVDPEHVGTEVSAARSPTSTVRTSKRARPVDGVAPFNEAMKQAPSSTQASLRRLVDWATDLEQRNLASLKTVLGDGRQILLVWLPGEQAGLVSIWNDGGASISLWRSVFVRHAWEQIDPIERLTGKAMGQGSGVRDPSPELLEVLSAAYKQAATGAPAWDGLSYYVTFGDGEERNWEDARKFGFVSAGGGVWYSNTLRQVPPGSRVFAYIPKRSGVKGYVGVGEVTGEAVTASEFIVDVEGVRRPLTDVAKADMTHRGTDDPEMAEWVLPVQWIHSLPREDAIRDSDLFANQNTAVRLTHGYTLRRLAEAFDLEPAPPP
jgi:hypothetical protein